MRKKIVLLLMVLGLSFVSVAVVWAQCTTYNNVSAYEGNLPTGPYCGGTSGSCTECITWNPSPGVWFSDCYYDAWSDNYYCYTYGTGENQIP